MATPEHDAPPSAPSLFLSYSSADRAAAKRLRDAIAAHGIEVWYDEDELTGGDAWDQKIRERIRRCDFFMPVISQSTESRREGYFRREWRQAAERTLDMADDVLFLLPLVIDPVPEASARVPERFRQVHWTRCPGGEPNDALAELCGRVLRGHDAAPLPAPPPPVPAATRTPKRNRRAPLPPYPPPPRHAPNASSLQYGVDVVTWAFRCGYRAWRGLFSPVRWILYAWCFFFLLSRCSSRGDRPDLAGSAEPETAVPAGLNSLGSKATELSRQLGEGGLGELGQFGRVVGTVIDAAQSGRALALVPINGEGHSAAAKAFAKRVFDLFFGEVGTVHPEQAALSIQPLTTAADTAEVLNRIARLDARFLVGGWIETDDSRGEILHLVLHGAGETEARWTGDFAVAAGNAEAAVAELQAAIVAAGVFAPSPPRAP